MELFKEDLLKVKEFMKKCKEREVLKRHMIILKSLGKFLYLTIDLYHQFKNFVANPINSLNQAEFIETTNFLETLPAKKPKRITTSPNEPKVG